MVFYCMVDKPAMRVQGKRKIHYTNKPRYEHKSLEEARIEAKRLAKKIGADVVILQAIERVKGE